MWSKSTCKDNLFLKNYFNQCLLIITFLAFAEPLWVKTTNSHSRKDKKNIKECLLFRAFGFGTLFGRQCEPLGEVFVVSLKLFLRFVTETKRVRKILEAVCRREDLCLGEEKKWPRKVRTLPDNRQLIEVVWDNISVSN